MGFFSAAARGTAVLVFCVHFAAGYARSQPGQNFSVDLHVDFNAAEETLRLFEDQPVGTGTLAALRGNQIAASTPGLIADHASLTDRLADYLDSLKFHQIIRNDVFRLEEGRANASAIRELLREMQQSGFSRKVSATVAQIFPADARVSLLIPVYVVALGHENVDAYVRRIVWHDMTPEFTGDDRGELTIVVNLAHAVRYGDDAHERFLTLLGVVAHEVFHAAFADYQDHAPQWIAYNRSRRAPVDELFRLTQNEGIAYYLSLDQQGRGYVPRDWYEQAKEIFAVFNRNAAALMAADLTPERASQLIRSANLSGYHESYGARCGMFMAREIDRQLGRAALIETIAKGPEDMLSKYSRLAERDNSLPPLSRTVLAKLPPIEK